HQRSSYTTDKKSRALSDQISGSEEGHIVSRIVVIDLISDNRETSALYIDREHFSSWEGVIYQ
ncbi:unnamed protein product, partial [Rotaria sordida]